MNAPLFPFGFGLSYTTFDYSKISLSDTLLIESKRELNISLKITNTGKYAGEETVQLYLNDPVASIVRPVKELKKFKKIFLQSGEAKQVQFTITPEELMFFNHDLKWDWEPGKFNIFVGTNSRDVETASFVWEK